MRILYKFPSRERNDKFFQAIENIHSMAMHPDYFIIASLDTDDVSKINEDVLTRMLTYKRLLPVFGTSRSKVHAINRDMDIPWALAINWDILCLHSDDMVFTKKGFDLDIIEAMQQHFPDTDGMLHFPDQKTETRDTCTYHIIGRKYYERSGYIYSPAYESLFADNEETEKARALGKYAFIDKQILEHRHPVWGYGEYDPLLKKTQRLWNRDKRVYNERKANNFGL